MTDLAQRVLDAIGETERVAQAATPGPWAKAPDRDDRDCMYGILDENARLFDHHDHLASAWSAPTLNTSPAATRLLFSAAAQQTGNWWNCAWRFGTVATRTRRTGWRT